MNTLVQLSNNLSSHTQLSLLVSDAENVPIIIVFAFSTELIKVLISAALKHAGFVHPLFTSSASYLTLERTHVV